MSGGKASDPLGVGNVLNPLARGVGDVARAAAGMNLATVLGGAASVVAPTVAGIRFGEQQMKKYDAGVSKLAETTKNLAGGAAQMQATENANRPVREALSAIIGQRRQTPGRRQVMGGAGGGLLGGSAGGTLLTPRGMS